MKIPTISEQILKYLSKRKRFVPGGVLERDLGVFHKPSTIGRSLRQMAEEGIILKDYKKIGRINYVVYRKK